MKDYEERRVEELWTRFLARDPLEAEERATLAAALSRDEVLRRRMIYDLQMEGALRAAGDVERGQEDVVAAVRELVKAAGRTEEVVAAVRKRLLAKTQPAPRTRNRRLRTSWLVGGAVMAASAALVLLFRPAGDAERGLSTESAEERQQAIADRAWLRGRGLGGRTPASGPAQTRSEGSVPPATMARLEAIEGTVYRHGREGIVRASGALDVAAGDWVSVSGPAARARLDGPGGSKVDITGDAVVGLSTEAAQPTAGRLFLAHGRATATIPTGRGRGLILASPHGVVTGSGSLRLDVGSSQTRVEVITGRAHVSALGVQQGAELSQRQFALVSADDLQPPRAQSTPRLALLLTGPDDTKEESPPPGRMRGSEERLKGRLERLGFAVEAVDARALTLEKARTAALLLLSSSVASNLLHGWMAELPVPLMVLESTGFEQLGLTGSRWQRDVGPAVPMTEVVIDNPGHPLASGMQGSVKVLSAPLNLRWARPPASATVIASYAGAPEQASLIFGYEKGAATTAGPAPARRVGMFLGNGRVIRALTEDGWRLFDAAVQWATEAR